MRSEVRDRQTRRRTSGEGAGTDGHWLCRHLKRSKWMFAAQSSIVVVALKCQQKPRREQDNNGQTDVGKGAASDKICGGRPRSQIRGHEHNRGTRFEPSRCHISFIHRVRVVPRIWPIVPAKRIGSVTYGSLYCARPRIRLVAWYLNSRCCGQTWRQRRGAQASLRCVHVSAIKEQRGVTCNGKKHKCICDMSYVPGERRRNRRLTCNFVYPFLL